MMFTDDHLFEDNIKVWDDKTASKKPFKEWLNKVQGQAVKREDV